MIGAYSIGNNVGDVIVMLLFGIVGTLMKKFRYDGAPKVLALVLGPMLEDALRQSLLLSQGNFSIFVSRPISLCFLILAVLLLVIPIVTQRKTLPSLRRSKEFLLSFPFFLKFLADDPSKLLLIDLPRLSHRE